ncbi:MAG TPA: hypothetical protein DHV74_02405 [Sulfitobacter sp.]|jgi:hypothetical protein|nr:hypothetical protein [Sulfitobacter sp.]|tara:strand:+ start:754 stop:1152 length:399 start_codon:yes stop_codon:yes gene_type:complete
MVEEMSYYNPHLMTKVVSSHIMKAANGKPCTLRIASFYPGHTCSSDDTTVGCHLSAGGKGTSTKETVLAVSFGCKACHDILDGRDWKRTEYIKEKYPMAFMERVLSSLIETQAMLVDDGLIVVPGAKILRSY